MKTTERFSNRVDDYRRYRPGYPQAIAELVREGCGGKQNAQVADIGSGTGIFTKVLLEAGLAVTAVEPNGPMRAVAEEELGSQALFRSVAAPAERTGLPEASCDAITVAQAFHWFDAEAARREFRRLLRPGGHVYLIWNERDREGSGLGRDYEALLVSLGRAYLSVAYRGPESGKSELKHFFLPGSMRVVEYDNPHALDWPGLRGRFLSASYAPAKGDARHEDCLRELERIFEANAVDGRVTFAQTARVYYGQLGDEPMKRPELIAG